VRRGRERPTTAAAFRVLAGVAMLAVAALATASASAETPIDAFTAVSISATPNVITLNQAVFLSGTLVEKDTPEAIANAGITLSRFIDAGCTQGQQQFATATTDSSGNWSTTDVSPIAPPVYYRADYAGGGQESPEDADLDNFLPSQSACLAVVPGRSLSGQSTGATAIDGVPFDSGQIDYGAVIDLKSGSKIKLSANVGRFSVYPGAGQETSFKVHRLLLGKGKKKQALIVLELVGGDFTSCGQQTNGFRTEAAKKKPPSRSLWASGKGHYRTKGKYSSATVSGTYYFVKDTCGGTLTYVKRGTVQVYDFVKNTTVIVHAGHSYFAKAPD
jgi:hypothetical protein